MQYEIEAGGRIRQVTVNREGGGFAIAVDGRVRYVDAVRIDAQTLSLIVDKVWLHDAVIAPEAAGGFVVRVGAVPVPVIVNGRRRRNKVGAFAAGGPAGSGPRGVVAPMPGKVVGVLVTVGDVVSAGQAVVVVEAMKMENEVRAGAGGTVAEIHARTGISVDAGTLLVVIR